MPADVAMRSDMFTRAGGTASFSFTITPAGPTASIAESQRYRPSRGTAAPRGVTSRSPGGTAKGAVAPRAAGNPHSTRRASPADALDAQQRHHAVQSRAGSGVDEAGLIHEVELRGERGHLERHGFGKRPHHAAGFNVG